MPKKLTRDKRMQVLLPSSLHERIRKIAYVKQVSVNNLVVNALKHIAEKNKASIDQYDAFFKEINNQEEGE